MTQTLPRDSVEATHLHLWTLTTTERLAQETLAQAERQLASLIGAYEKDRDAFLDELERRCKLPAGAIRTTHILDRERNTVRERRPDEISG